MKTEKDSGDQKANLAEAGSILSEKKKSLGMCKKHNLPLMSSIGDMNIVHCSKCVEEMTEDHEFKKILKRQEERKETALKKAFDGIRIGKRFKDAIFEDYEEVCSDAGKVKSACMKYAATFHDRLKAGDGLIFSGNVGTGKNMLAACIAKAAVEAGFTSLHTTVLKMVRQIKRTWNTKECEQEAIDKFSGPDLLIINEVGIQFESKTEELYLSEIIDDRYEAMKATILISNFKEAELSDILGPRIIDRYYEGGSCLLSFTWGSHRRKGV